MHIAAGVATFLVLVGRLRLVAILLIPRSAVVYDASGELLCGVELLEDLRGASEWAGRVGLDGASEKGDWGGARRVVVVVVVVEEGRRVGRASSSKDWKRRLL